MGFLIVLATAQKYVLGESSYAYSSLVLRKREQALSVASDDVAKVDKTEFLYSAVFGLKLLDFVLVKSFAEL